METLPDASECKCPLCGSPMSGETELVCSSHPNHITNKEELSKGRKYAAKRMKIRRGKMVSR